MDFPQCVCRRALDQPSALLFNSVEENERFCDTDLVSVEPCSLRAACSHHCARALAAAQKKIVLQSFEDAGGFEGRRSA